MKKSLAFMMALALVVMMTGCSVMDNTTVTPTEVPAAATEAPIATETATEAPVMTEVPAAAETAAAEATADAQN